MRSQRGGVALRDHYWWVKSSVTSRSSSDVAACWSGLLPLPMLPCSVLISLSSSCRRCSTRDVTCRQRDGGRFWSCKTSLMREWQQDMKKWDTGKLKGWVRKNIFENWLEVLHSPCKNFLSNQEVSSSSLHIHRRYKIKNVKHVGCHLDQSIYHSDGAVSSNVPRNCIKIFAKVWLCWSDIWK